MKKSILFLVFFAGMMVAEVAIAQNQNRFPRLRERLTQAKLREIQKSLSFDEQTFNKFRPVYLKYEQEVSEIDLRKLAPLMRVNADSVSNEEADQLIVSQLETAKKLISIREKYYHEFRKVISPQEIIKLYQTEAEIRREVMQEFRKRIMSR